MEDLMRAKDILDEIKKHKEAATGEEKFGPPSPFADGYRMAHDHIAEVVQVCVKTVDAVEVVRCRDCKYGEYAKNGYNEDMISCKNPETAYMLAGWLNSPDWFCADGVERDKGDEE